MEVKQNGFDKYYSKYMCVTCLLFLSLAIPGSFIIE